MIRLSCKNCNKNWIVEEKSISFLKVCPFCENSIKKKKIVIKDGISSFDDVISQSISGLGIAAWLEPKKLMAYMLDIAPQFDKEIRIFFRMSEKNFNSIYNIFKQNNDDEKIEFSKLKKTLIDYEGFSEMWADFICNSCLASMQLSNEEYLDADTCPLSSNMIEPLDEMPTFEEHNTAIPGIDSFSYLTGQRKNVKKISKANLYVYNKALSLEESGQVDNAISLYNTLAHPAVYVRLGFLHDRLEHPKAAWKNFLKASEEDDPEAMFFIGYFYWCGRHVQQSKSKAVNYFKKAAEEGVVEAMIVLSMIYKNDNEDMAEKYRNLASNTLKNRFLLDGMKKILGVWLIK